MKPSKYNIYLEEYGKTFIFNQLTGSLSEFDRVFFNTIKNNTLPIDIDEKEKEFLMKSNFLCDNNLQEELILLQRNRIRRYGNRSARITIMPTLDCNFRCWYCYESHLESKMNKQTIESVILFVKNLIIQNNLKVLELDWFGGEPLLNFDEVMYPIAKEIMKFCEEKNTYFQHGITTNGYLITPVMVEKFKEIQLNRFQITLDGSEEFHNKTRFSETDKNTYNTNVQNITLLCSKMDMTIMDLRVNYTPQNLSSINKIAVSFPKEVRSKIRIIPQIIWQYKNGINEINDTIHKKLETFSKEGYKVDDVFLSSPRGIGCYVENMLQFVVNYDGSLYKCTARDFKDKTNSIGYLNLNGEFISNSNYYKYFTSSAFENPMCLACELLPSCTGMCLQKKLENGLPACHKDSVYNSLINQLKLIVSKNEQVRAFKE